MSQVKDKDFVHKFTFSGDSLHYALATKQQLYDLECFCTDSANFSVFFIDSTFDAGNYFVTKQTCGLCRRTVPGKTSDDDGSNLYPYKAGNE